MLGVRRLLVLKKVLRDLRQGWLSFGACLAMLCLSVSLFLAFFTAAHSLERSTEATYRNLKFLDLTLPVNNSSQITLQRLRSIPGVEAIAGRATTEVRILLDPLPTSANHSRSSDGLAISLPHDQHPEVNDVFVEEGRYLAQNRGEVLLEKRFARHHGYKVGDLLRVEHWNSERRFRIVGLVSSPEYVWMVTNRFDPRPVEKRYGVFFLSEQDVFSMLGGAYLNEIHLRLSPEVDPEVVAVEAERRLASEINGPTVLRKEQPSHSLVLRDRQAFRGLAVFFPTVFLSLSSVTLFSTLWQLVSRQRRQIGILMSQGCSSSQLMGQYLLLGLLVGGLGGLLGIVIGIPLGRFCTNFYTQILGLPFVEVSTPLGSVAAIFVLSLLLSLFSAWTATRRILKLDPIRAIRMEFQEGWAPRKQTALDRFLPTRWRFALRNLARNPGRTLLSVLGIAVSVAQIVMTLALVDSQQETLRYYFSSVHRYDYELSLHSVTGETSLPHLWAWPEVEKMETCLRRSAVLKFEGRELLTNVWGVSPQSELLKLYDESRRPLRLNSQPTLFMGRIQMMRLGVEPGDQITLSLHRFLPGAPEFRFTVGPALHEPMAHPPKLSLPQLQQITAKSEDAPMGGANVLLVRARPGQKEALAQKLAVDDRFAGVFSPAQMEDEVKELLRMFNAYKALILAFTALFALVVLLGTTTMNVLERRREFATLSCLGVRDGTLARLILSETLLMWLMGLGLGVPAGLALGTKMLNSFQSQLLRLDLTLTPWALASTSALSLAICLVALMNGLYRLRSVPLTAATQEVFE